MRDSWKSTMKKLLLLDADIVLDLHSLDLFEKIRNAYSLCVTKVVFREAKYYKKDGIREKINIKDKVTVIEQVDIENLKTVSQEAKEAMLIIDSGEASSIAYLIDAKEDITFCSCDKAAITLTAYMELEQRAICLEKALKNAGIHVQLLPRHLHSNFKDCINEGKALRVQYKLLT